MWIELNVLATLNSLALDRLFNMQKMVMLFGVLGLMEKYFAYEECHFQSLDVRAV